MTIGEAILDGDGLPSRDGSWPAISASGLADLVFGAAILGAATAGGHNLRGTGNPGVNHAPVAAG